MTRARRLAAALALAGLLVVSGCGLLSALRGSSVELAAPDGGPSVRVTLSERVQLDGGLAALRDAADEVDDASAE